MVSYSPMMLTFSGCYVYYEHNMLYIDGPNFISFMVNNRNSRQIINNVIRRRIIIRTNKVSCRKSKVAKAQKESKRVSMAILCRVNICMDLLLSYCYFGLLFIRNNRAI